MTTDPIPALFSSFNFLEMLRGGMDTRDIADHLGIKEHDVYNAMRPREILWSKASSQKNVEQWKRTRATNARLREASRIAGPVDGSG
jgi:phage antirepressor YoqD-like protein